MTKITGTNNSYIDEIIGFSIIIIIFLLLRPLLAESLDFWIILITILVGMILGGILSAYAARLLKLEEFEEEIPNNIEEIQLAGRSIQTINLEALPELQQLKILNLENNLMEKLDFSPFRKHPSLEDLDVSNNKLKVIDLTVMKTCQKLRRLDLRQNQIEALEAADLLKLKNFKELHIDKKTKLTVDGVKLSSDQFHEMIEKGITDVDNYLMTSN